MFKVIISDMKGGVSMKYLLLVLVVAIFGYEIYTLVKEVISNKEKKNK